MRGSREIKAILDRHGRDAQRTALDYLAELHEGSAGVFDPGGNLILGRGIPVDGWQFVLAHLDQLRDGAEELSHGQHSIVALRSRNHLAAVFYSAVPWVDARLAREAVGPILEHVPLDSVPKAQRGHRWEVSREQILWMLQRCEGSVSRSARAFGVARGTLYARMREHHIG